MISIKEKCEGKIWKALQFMADGLVNQSKREDFVIDMDTFGSVDEQNNICYGCAATCAIQEIAGENFDKDIFASPSRSRAIGLDRIELHDFEWCINTARQGILYSLFNFFDKPRLHKDDFDGLFKLNSNDWQEHLTKVQLLIDELKSQDI